MYKEQISYAFLDTLNDPFEGIGFFDFNSCDKNYWNAIGVDLPSHLSKYFQEEVKEKLCNCFRVFCCTKDPLNPLMWAHYADGHQGICIGYDLNSVMSTALMFGDVQYEPIAYEPQDGGDYKNLLFHKSEIWGYEKEARGLYKLSGDELQSISREQYFSECEADGKVCFMDERGCYRAEKYIIKHCKINEIYLGLKIDVATRNEIICFSNKKGIGVKQVALLPRQYKLVAKDLE